MSSALERLSDKHPKGESGRRTGRIALDMPRGFCQDVWHRAVR